MAVEIGPALGLTADSTSLELATADLKALSVAAKQAETAAHGLEGKTRGLGAAMKEQATAAREANTVLAQQVAKQKEAASAAAELARKQAEAKAQATQAAASYSALRASLDPLYATSKRYETAVEALNAAQSAGVISDAERARTLGLLDAQFELAALSSKKLAGNTAYTSNVFSQFNDIGMQTFAGQSPMMLAVQQGTQLNQVFAEIQRTGGGASAIFSTLRGALSSMISPTSLLTLGVIAGGAALVQWGMSALGAKDDAVTFSDQVDTLASSVSALSEISNIYSAEGLTQMRDKYGEVTVELLAMIEAQRVFAVNTAMTDSRNAVVALSSEYSALSGSVDLYAKTGRGDMAALTDELGLNKNQVVGLARAYQDVRNATTFEEQAAALRRVNSILAQSSISSSELAKKTLEAEDAMRQLATSAPAASWMSAAISGVLSLGDAIRARITEANALRELANAPGMDTGTPLYQSGYNGIGLPGSSLIPSDKESLPPGYKAPKGGGGGGGENKRQTQLDDLIKSLQTERETIDAWHTEQLTSLAVFSDAELAALGGTNEAKLRLETEYQERLKGIKSGYNGDALSQASTFFGELQSATQSGSDGMLRISKVAGAAQALINSYVAYTEVLKDPTLPWFARIPAAVGILSAGLGMVNAIKGGSKGGGGRGAGSASAGSSSQSAAPEAPLRATFDAINPSALYTGAALIQVFDAIQKEAGNRGIIWTADGAMA